ncbi:MAG: energy transducer TonB [Spirochaetales bacterium]|nr:energy transducer TonB [Spirochaetales bacterium]
MGQAAPLSEDKNQKPPMSSHLLSYKQQILEEVGRNKIYPASARKREQEDQVEVKVIIGSNGRILSLSIINPSEYTLLNDATLRAVRKASPFPSLPENIDEFEMTFVMNYELQ